VFSSLAGKVYNVSSYLDFHPGGVEELMRGAGKDATGLFDEVGYSDRIHMVNCCIIHVLYGVLIIVTP